MQRMKKDFGVICRKNLIHETPYNGMCVSEKLYFNRGNYSSYFYPADC